MPGLCPILRAKLRELGAKESDISGPGAMGSMRVREWRSTQGAMKNVMNATALAVLSVAGGVADTVLSTTPAGVAAVTSPSQFQEAVRSGVKHIVINEHLDMTTTPSFSETTRPDAGAIAVVLNSNREYTNTIRVRGCRCML